MKTNNKKYTVLLYNRTKKLIYAFFNFVKSIKYKIINEITLCHIEEINLTEKTIIIHCKGVDAPIKLTLDEIINDPIILANLSSKQASWIGYYYGKHYSELINEKNVYSNILNFSIDDASGKSQIIMLNRHGHLIYSNQNNIYTISPINAMRSETIITQFTPIQACYIGLLAGACNPKKINHKTDRLTKAHLKIVK